MKARPPAATPAPPPERSALWAKSWSGVKAALGVCLVLGTAGATAFGSYRLALSSPSFAIRHVEVETSRRLPDREVARRAGIVVGESLLGLDLAQAERRLLADPWVQSVKVTRKLPQTVRIQLSEHEAVALAAIDAEIFLVAATGEPFKAWEAGDVHDLPVLTGVTAEALAQDRQGAVARLGTGLRVLEHYQRLPVSRVQRPEEVHLGPDGSVVLTVGVHGVALHLGHGPWPKKLLMVAEVLRKFDAQRELPGVVFLDNEFHPERVVVRMR
jgi:cell division protein FtsQ